MYLGIVPLLLQAKSPIDLEQKAQDFVLETKQIIIPGFPGAFNPSIIRWKNSLLMSFRIRDEKMISTFEMGFVWLDEHFNPISTPCVLDIRDNPSIFYRNQDPRLITINKDVYIVYSNFIKIDQTIVRRMFIAPLQYEDDTFFITNPLCLHSFDGDSNKLEKNWTPFNYNEDLLLAYSLLPHRILKYFDSGTCSTISSTHSSIDWNWGQLRGGTPAFLIDNQYVGFFHSSKKFPSVQSNGRSMIHYVMGAYTFSDNPPFNITSISPEPILGKKFYSGPTYNTWKPMRVVFPGGYIFDEQYIWVAYGRQDHEIWVAKLDKNGLLKSLVPCSIKPEIDDITNDYSKDIEIDYDDDSLEYENPSNNTYSLNE